jgi:hypothetical protein
MAWQSARAPVGRTDCYRLRGHDDEPNLAENSLSHPAVARLANDEHPGRRAVSSLFGLRQAAGYGRCQHDRRVIWRSSDICKTVVQLVAWTLADLAGRSVPGSDEIAEALGMRLQRVAA